MMKTRKVLPNIFWGMLVYLQYFILLIPFSSFCMPAVSVTSTGKKLPPIYWNYSNPIFSPSSDNRISANLFDSIEVYCPYYLPSSNNSSWEYYVIYLVNKTEYDECTIFDPNKALMIINCSNPSKIDIFFTIWIDPFNGFPNQPDFSSGGTYYLITTSTGTQNGLANQYHGACSERNMRLKINICCSSNSTSTPDSSTKTTTTPGGHHTQPPPTQNPQTPAPTTKRPSTPAPTKPPPSPTTTQKPSTTTNFPGGQPSDPSQQIIIATGDKNSGLINSAQTLKPSWTILVLVTLTLTYVIRSLR